MDRTLEMTSDALIKGGKLHNVIKNNFVWAIWANQKTETCVYRWLRALAMFDLRSFPAILLGIGRHFNRFVDTLMIFFATRRRGRTQCCGSTRTGLCWRTTRGRKLWRPSPPNSSRSSQRRRMNCNHGNNLGTIDYILRNFYWFCRWKTLF